MTARHLATLAALAVMLGAATASAGVLEVACVAPTTDNDGSCDSVVSVPRWGDPPLWVHFQWMSTVRGGSFGHDSLNVAPGDTLVFSRWVPGGDYRARLWASDAGGAGCATDTVLKVKGWPGHVKLVKP